MLYSYKDYFSVHLISRMSLENLCSSCLRSGLGIKVCLSIKLLIGNVLCQSDSLEIYEGIALSLRQYGQPLVIIEFGIKFCLSIIIVCKNSGGFLC